MSNNAYNVQFTGDYFSMTVYVADVQDEKRAMEKASNLLLDYYDWNVIPVSNDIEVFPQD